MKKRKTVIKLGQDQTERPAQISTQVQQGNGQAGYRKMSDPTSSPSVQGYNIQSRKQSTPNDFGRPNVGMRRPSLSEITASPIYDTNYVAQVAPNMEPALGPGSYYADTSYGRSRRKGSNEADFFQQSRANNNRSRQGSNPFPDEVEYQQQQQRGNGNRSRQGSNSDERFDAPFRARQGSIPYVEYGPPDRYPPPGNSEYRGQDRRRAGSFDRNASTSQPIPYSNGPQRQQSISNPNSPRRTPAVNSQRQRYPTTEEVFRPDDRYRGNRPANMAFFPSRGDIIEPVDLGFRTPNQRRPSAESNQSRPSYDEGDRVYRGERDRTKTPIPGEYQQPIVGPSSRPMKQQRPVNTESKRVDELGAFLSNVLADCEDFLGKC